MKQKGIHNLLLLVLITALFCEIGIVKVISDSRRMRLSSGVVEEQGFRDQEIGEEMLAYIKKTDRPATEVGLYLLESKFGYQPFVYGYTKGSFLALKSYWKKDENWNNFLKYTKAIWNDLKYFPVPESTTDKALQVNFSNSWMAERTYGGKRGHEGTDIMASENVSGIYPIVSMTDGIVKNKGWLEQGGYRIGIEAPSGAYFYYAHLDSYADIEVGDEIQAGTLLGFMGDTGYGEEGTRGQFPVHLHVGVYIYPEGKETSVNPYWLLRYLENRKIKSSYSSRDVK